VIISEVPFIMIQPVSQTDKHTGVRRRLRNYADSLFVKSLPPVLPVLSTGQVMESLNLLLQGCLISSEEMFFERDP
jgi:hypothetical protein